MSDWIFPIILACIVTAFVIAPNIRYVGLEKAIAVGAGLFGAGALVWLLLAVSGCSKRVPETKIESNKPGWCFLLESTFQGKVSTWQVCGETETLCNYVRGVARKHGSRGGVTGVDESCSTEVEP